VESKISPNIRPLQPGDQETDAEVELTAGWHRVKLELYVGGKKRRLEVGERVDRPGRERCVWVIGNAKASGGVPPGDKGVAFPLTDDGWLAFERGRDEMV
jgi:hypothetical protein